MGERKSYRSENPYRYYHGKPIYDCLSHQIFNDDMVYMKGTLIVVDHLHEDGKDDGFVVWRGDCKNRGEIPNFFKYSKYIRYDYDRENQVYTFHIFSAITEEPIITVQDVTKMIDLYKNNVDPPLTSEEILERMGDVETFYRDFNRFYSELEK